MFPLPLRERAVLRRNQPGESAAVAFGFDEEPNALADNVTGETWGMWVQGKPSKH